MTNEEALEILRRLQDETIKKVDVLIRAIRDVRSAIPEDEWPKDEAEREVFCDGVLAASDEMWEAAVQFERWTCSAFLDAAKPVYCEHCERSLPDGEKGLDMLAYGTQANRIPTETYPIIGHADYPSPCHRCKHLSDGLHVGCSACKVSVIRPTNWEPNEA